MLTIKLFWLVFCLYRLNRNIETFCFGIEAKQPKQTNDSAETSFGSSFSCFESKVVSKDTLFPSPFTELRFKGGGGKKEHPTRTVVYYWLCVEFEVLCASL
jgi:hypothetical protein